MIEIDGHELPTKGLEGSPDFKLRPWRSELQIWFRCGSGFFQAWGALCSIEKYHAACVAHKYYLWLADEYKKRDLFCIDCDTSIEPAGEFEGNEKCEKCGKRASSGHAYFEHHQHNAAAWGQLADKLMEEG